MNKVKVYVDGLFSGLRETPQIAEQKEEIIADVNAKIIDLVSQGESENKALGIALESLGDFEDLLDEYRVIQAEEDKQIAMDNAWKEEELRQLAEEMTRPAYMIRESAFNLHWFVYAGLMSLIVAWVMSFITLVMIGADSSVLALPVLVTTLFILGVLVLLALWHRDHTIIEEIRPDFKKEYLWGLGLFLAVSFLGMGVAGEYSYNPAALIFEIVFWAATFFIGGVFVKQKLLQKKMFSEADGDPDALTEA